MKKEALYCLADTTVIEPLVNQWPAWAQLLSPLPAGLHAANYQTSALRSYLEDPEAHVKASRDPEMIGGPFVDIPVERAGEVRELLARTEERQRRQIELAKVFTEFHNSLVDEATGQSLEPFYRTVPDMLGGYVELVYDYYNRPTVRCFESLLYESEYYDRSLQSLRLWRLAGDGARAFFMSTPHLLGAGELELALPFDHPRTEKLYRLDTEPQPLAVIRDIFGLSPEDDERLLPLLTESPAPPPAAWDGETVRIRYVGHACVLIEWRGTTILTDPYIGVRPAEGGMERISYRDLPEHIDYALVTHNHQDHFALETLLRLRHRIRHLVVPRSFGMLHGDMSLKLMMRQLGFESVSELDALESIAIPDGRIVGVPFLGEHGDLACGKTGFVIRCGNEQMLIGADSDCLDERVYENVRKSLGAIETVFLGTESVGAPLFWCIGSLFLRRPQHQHEQSRRFHGCNARSALDILETVGAQRIYNYAMGMEPWIEHLLGLGLTETSPQYIESERLLEAARLRGFVAAARLYGTSEIHLGADASEPARDLWPVGVSVLSETGGAHDEEDQFVF
jgi:hypothetical protein